MLSLYKEGPDSTKELDLLLTTLDSLFDDLFLNRIINEILANRTTIFAPRLPDFVAVGKELRKTEYTSANEAWKEVMLAVKKGARGLTLLDDITRQAMDQTCNWETFRSSENPFFFRNTFIGCYNSIVEDKCRFRLNES